MIFINLTFAYIENSFESDIPPVWLVLVSCFGFAKARPSRIQLMKIII